MDDLQDGVHEVSLAGVPVQGQDGLLVLGVVLDGLDAPLLVEQVC